MVRGPGFGLVGSGLWYSRFDLDGRLHGDEMDEMRCVMAVAVAGIVVWVKVGSVMGKRDQPQVHVPFRRLNLVLKLGRLYTFSYSKELRLDKLYGEDLPRL